MKNIVILDGHTANPGDLSWSALEALGNLTVHPRTPPELVVERATHADIVLTNKTVLGAEVLEQLPRLKFVSVLATGYNVVDVGAAKQLGITVSNVRGYAANAVAQHVFALVLEFTNQVAKHSQHVAAGGWSSSSDWSYSLGSIPELAGKTIGIYGLGQIGQRVADIALAFGMRVVACHKHPERDERPGVEFVSFGKLLEQADVLTLHAPLTPDNHGIMNMTAFGKMLPTAFFVNTGRGGLVVEEDLRLALETGLIAGAGLDVLTLEPPLANHPLVGLRNCIITPHNAWAAREARERLIAESAENVRSYLEGMARNVVGG